MLLCSGRMRDTHPGADVQIGASLPVCDLKQSTKAPGCSRGIHRVTLGAIRVPTRAIAPPMPLTGARDLHRRTRRLHMEILAGVGQNFRAR